MAKPRMDLSAFVGKLLEEQDGDVLREGIRVLSQALMETEVAGLIGNEVAGQEAGIRGHFSNVSDCVLRRTGGVSGTISATGCGWAWSPAKGHENRSLVRMSVLGAARSRLAMEQARPSNCLTQSVHD
jgi:hypothetical protein